MYIIDYQRVVNKKNYRTQINTEYVSTQICYNLRSYKNLQIHRISAQNACQSRRHCDNHFQDHIPY